MSTKIACIMASLCVLGAYVDPNLRNDIQSQPASPRDKTAVVQGDNAFALDLYARLKDKEGNLFLSPFSISTALAMTYAGARGQTAEEMAATLHFTLNQDGLHPALGALIHDLNGPGKKRGYQLSVANALWVQKGHPFLPEFLKLNKDYYGAGANEVNYAPDPEEARQTINAWVAQHTHDKIKDLLAKGVLDASSRLVLTNAIYFKGDWSVKFKKEFTKDGPFFTGKAKTHTPLMHQMEHFNYLETDAIQALEMPYAGKDLSMVVFLPKKVDGLAALEKTLTASNLSAWLSKLRQQEVEVFLPKFKVTAKFSLAETLSAMGMPRAFSTMADFSGMDGSKDLYLSAVIHQAFVDVNEEGTEAAGATGVGVKALAAPAPPPVFRADHPFIFLIRDVRSGSILFLGRIVQPPTAA